MKQPTTVATAEAKPNCAPVPGSETVEQTHKYLEVEITRTQGTLVFLKVPKDFNHRACSNLKEILKAAAVETCDESDWRLGSDQWEDSIEWQAIKEVPQKEAEAYTMYEVESPNVCMSHGGHK